jgi:hypothetical protein
VEDEPAEASGRLGGVAATARLLGHRGKDRGDGRHDDQEGRGPADGEESGSQVHIRPRESGMVVGASIAAEPGGG